jgi:hypothetical protein
VIVEDGVAAKTIAAYIDLNPVRAGLVKAPADYRWSSYGELSLGKMLRCRVRYFTDGAVIGSGRFVNEAFAGARERFGPKRKDGARRMRGAAAAATMAGKLWSLRDLQKGIV